MMKSLAFYCPLSTHSLLGKLVWMQHFNQRLTYIIRPCRSRVDGVCVRAFVGRVRAYFTQNQPTNPACFQKVWARGASPLPSPPATAGFQGSPVSQYFWGDISFLSFEFLSLSLVPLLAVAVFGTLRFFSPSLQWCRLFWGRRCREFCFDLQKRDWWSSLKLKSHRTEDIFSVPQVNSLIVDSEICVWFLHRSKYLPP